MLAQKQHHSQLEEQHVAFLREVTLFEDLRAAPGAIEALSQVMEARNYSPGNVIIREGETGAEMFLLVEGEASVFKKTSEGEEYKVAILQGAQRVFFGEGGLLDSDARSATIRAETPCYCLVLQRSVFEKYSKNHPEWALPVLLRIARAVMGRLKKTNNDLALLYNALVSEIRGH